jgi:hypothetical protein
LAGKDASPPRWPPDVEFYLDECLPEQIAQALRLVQYPITYPELHGKKNNGTKDPDLIPYLAAKRLVWVTSDAAAKRVHGNLLRKHQLSALWVRGLERRDGTSEQKVGMHDVHHMLTAKLPEFARKVAASRGMVHGAVSLNVNVPKLSHVDFDHLQRTSVMKVTGKW